MFNVTKYSNFLTRWSVSSQSQAEILSRETRCDTVAMFLLRNIMEMVKLGTVRKLLTMHCSHAFEYET